jgi:hypothetical protein
VLSEKDLKALEQAPEYDGEDGDGMDSETEGSNAEDSKVHMRGGQLDEEDLAGLGVASNYDDEEEDVEMIHGRYEPPPLLGSLPVKSNVPGHKSALITPDATEDDEAAPIVSPSSSDTAGVQSRGPPFRSSGWTPINDPALNRARDPMFLASRGTPANLSRHDFLPGPSIMTTPVNSPASSDSSKGEIEEATTASPPVLGPMTPDEFNAWVTERKEKAKSMHKHLQCHLARLAKGTHQQRGAAEECIERLQNFRRKLDWYALPEESRPPPSQVPRNKSPIDWASYPIASRDEYNAAETAWRSAERAESRQRFLAWAERKTAGLAGAADTEETRSATSKESDSVTDSDDEPVFANRVLVSPTPSSSSQSPSPD